MIELFLKDNKVNSLTLKNLETELMKVEELDEKEKGCKAVFRG